MRQPTRCRECRRGGAQQLHRRERLLGAVRTRQLPTLVQKLHRGNLFRRGARSHHVRARMHGRCEGRVELFSVAQCHHYLWCVTLGAAALRPSLTVDVVRAFVRNVPVQERLRNARRCGRHDTLRAAREVLSSERSSVMSPGSLCWHSSSILRSCLPGFYPYLQCFTPTLCTAIKQF